MPDVSMTAGAAVLVTEKGTMCFGGLIAVSQVSFTCPRGAVTAMIGPNGAGTTTTFRAQADHAGRAVGWEGVSRQVRGPAGYGRLGPAPTSGRTPSMMTRLHTLSVEFRHRSWFGEHTASTLAFEGELGVVHPVVGGP